jgi:hypothetical protein
MKERRSGWIREGFFSFAGITKANLQEKNSIKKIPAMLIHGRNSYKMLKNHRLRPVASFLIDLL